jgi:hypothetical protein
MKKIALLLLGFWVATMVAPVYAGEVVITDENVARLKGTWPGSRDVIRISTSNRSFPSDFIIENDDIPLRGMLINYNTGSGNKSYSFDGGIIEKGKLFIRLDKSQWISLTLYVSRSNKMELRGEYQLDTERGFSRANLSFVQSKN